MKNLYVLLPLILFLTILWQKSTAINAPNTLRAADTTKLKLTKLEFVTDKYDTVSYIINQDNLFYTIRKADVLISHIPQKILDVLKASTIVVVYMHINQQIFSAKPNPFYSSTLPEADYYFPTDNKGAIVFWREGSINLIKIPSGK